MNTGLWIVQALLAVAFLMVGMMKIIRPYQQIKERMAWVEDFSPTIIRGIGVVEILGAVGLVLPALTGILPIMTVLAAVGLALTMLGAVLTHVRRNEYQMVIGNLVLLVLAAFVAYGRFVLEPLGQVVA